MPRYPQTVLISCEVPWDEQMQLLEETFRREIQHVLKSFNHLYIFGTAGEGYAVDSAQFERIVRIFYEETRAADVHPMVGVIGLSTPMIVERISQAYAVGFRVFQISLPSWGTVTDNEMMTFFEDVCGQFDDCRFLHYNLPRSGRVLGGKEYKRLIEAIPNLVATKTTSGGLPGAADLMFHAPELQHFMGEVNFPHGCMFGECSLLASSGPMAPGQTWAFFEAGRTRDIEQLFRWQHDFYHMKHDVLGPARGHAHMDGAFDKLIKRLGGFEEMPLRLLSPYQGVSEEVFQTCKQIYQTKYPAWASGNAIS
jgi:dihydrodipicolinate synthase/N-acetylneuraminate lyase